MSIDETKATLYPLQEAVLASLQAIHDPQMAVAKLCGGTALSRCWLNHRVSFDLDFFFPEGFRAGPFAVALRSAGIDYETRDIVDDPRKANQLHGYVLHADQRLKVSFVEDAYFGLYSAIEAPFGAATVRTEEIPGLYHRKLRTVAGSGSEGESFEGGRQKARDLFDLYVLSQAHMPIRAFIATLPYPFPSAAFDNGLASMPWFDLMDELGEIACESRWEQAKDINFLQNALYQQIGADSLPDQWLNPPSPAAGSGKPERGIRKQAGTGPDRKG